MIGAKLARASASTALAVLACALVAAPAGAKTKTKTYSSGPIAAPIADSGVSLFPISAKGKQVKKVTAAVRITHPFDSDLDIYLVSPRARFVQLSADNGGTGNDYGSGPADCTGTFTTFADSAATAITAGAAPFAGAFKPQQPLAALKGTKAKGQWQLMIVDDDPRDAGTLGCWQLTIAAKK